MTAPRAGHAGRLLTLLVLGSALVSLSCLASLALGSTHVPASEVWAHLTGGPRSPAVAGRSGRTLVGLAVGASTGVAGAAMQALTRNPLADPGLLGVNSGATLAIVIGLTTGWLGDFSSYAWAGMLGAAVAALVVYGVATAAPGGAQPVTMTIAGAAFAASTGSVVSGILLADEKALESFRGWQVGTVAGRQPELVLQVAPVLLLGFALTLTSGGRLNTLALGDDMARGLGQRVALVRAVVALGAVALCAGATALAGPIGFVGLVVPHVVRLVTGPDERRVLLGSALVGAALLVAADTVGRLVMPPTEIAAGIMTATLGAPALLLLLRSRRVR